MTATEDSQPELFPQEEDAFVFRSDGSEVMRIMGSTTFIGGYQIGGPNALTISFAKRPRWFHRVMMKLCLGWKWVDKAPHSS